MLQVEEGLSKGQTASIHGSLLIIGEMLSHTGDFMVPRFQEVRPLIAEQEGGERKDRRPAGGRGGGGGQCVAPSRGEG